MLKKVLLSSLILLANINSFAWAETKEDKLKKLFSPAQVTRIKNYKTSFENAKSAQDFEKVYGEAIKLKNDLYDTMNKKYEEIQRKTNTFVPKEDFEWINSFIPAMEITSVAEGTQLDLVANYNAFKTLAKKTPQKEDDLFINIMLDAYDGYGDFYTKWFTQTWDYGGYTNLGVGKHTQVLLAIDKFLSQNTLFKKELGELRDKALKDILNENNFGEPKEKVIKEINGIIKNIKLSESEKNKLKNRIIQLNSKKGTLQFDCKKKTCVYG